MIKCGWFGMYARFRHQVFHVLAFYLMASIEYNFMIREVTVSQFDLFTVAVHLILRFLSSQIKDHKLPTLLSRILARIDVC